MLRAQSDVMSLSKIRKATFYSLSRIFAANNLILLHINQPTPSFQSKHNTSSHSDPPQADKPTCADGTVRHLADGSHANGVIKSGRRPRADALKNLYIAHESVE